MGMLKAAGQGPLFAVFPERNQLANPMHQKNLHSGRSWFHFSTLIFWS